MSPRLYVGTLLFLLLAPATSPSAQEPSSPHRVYAHRLEPAEHPDYARRAVKPPTWDTFGDRTRFATLRGFAVDNGQITGYAEELDKYVNTFDLGEVIWPSYPVVFAENMDALAAEIKQRGLFLFDIWGYVPGSGPGDYWQQYKPPRETLDMLEATLGDHWLGMDVGEQDGRYIGGYAEQMHPISGDRFAQYLNFQRHFERMGNDLGNKLSTLVSLNFGHYFLKESTYTVIGAETAQALPNSQVYYAFIRGAGKQYGVPWFGNASVWNRWGYKNYDSTGPDHSAMKGTSLNLLKRLLYSHILYNAVFVGFESGWFQGNELSPIGRIQQAAQRWVREHGQPGVMHTPVALLFDFYAGWTFPRHLYTPYTYRVWGNVPYGPGDHLADGILDMLYPGYQDASYFHDESGFMTPTPYGDAADCLLSDAEGWLLDRYPIVIAVSELTAGPALRDKLTAYVEHGGHLVITGGNLARFDGGLCGIRAEAQPTRQGGPVQVGGTPFDERLHFSFHALSGAPEARVLASCGDLPAAISQPFGKGRITAFAASFAVPDASVLRGPIQNTTDASLSNPFPLLGHVRALLDPILRSQLLFEAGEGLSLITCRKSPGRYVLGLCNNSLKPLPFAIVSHCGPIASVLELILDQSERYAIGYLPEGMEQAEIGLSDFTVITGGDVRLFEVTVREEEVVETPHEAPPARIPGRILPLAGRATIREEILARPTFFEHYDGVSVDWRYFHDRSIRALTEEGLWLARQGVRVYADLASGVNLYPDLRLVDNDPEEYASSMAVVSEVLAKMEAAGAHDLLVQPHRAPENSFSGSQTLASFQDTLRGLCEEAAAHGITVYLRVSTKLQPDLAANAEFVRNINAPNLFLAPSLALLLHQQRTPESISEEIQQTIGLWLAAAPAYDTAGTLWTGNAPLKSLPDITPIREIMKTRPGVPILFDVSYANQDAEYRDAAFLEGGVAPIP